MKLFSSTQISWSEPWFFLISIREVWGWRRRILLAIAIAALMFVGTYFFGGGRFGLPESIGISIVCGLVLVSLLDVGNLQREVTIKEDCIIVGSTIGQSWFCDLLRISHNVLRFRSTASVLGVL